MQRKALGKGIGALFSGSQEKTKLGGTNYLDILEVDVGKIQPNPYQPRKSFDEKDLSELSVSIKENGILQPLLVRQKGSGFDLIAGERRLRAAKIAGLKSVPVVIREASREGLLALALVENIQRKNLNPIEAAKGYKQLIEEFGLTQEGISKRVGKDRSTIANTLRLLTLPVSVQREILSGRLSYGHAKVLLSIKLPSLVERTAQQVIQNGLSVRETENRVKKEQRHLGEDSKGSKNPELIEMEEKLMRHLGVKVKVRGNKDKGKILLKYYSSDDLDRLLDVLLV